MTAKQAREFWAAHGEALRGFHLRERMRPRGGNQWYLDRGPRKVATLCGAEPGDHDAPATDAGTKLNGPYTLSYCCPACAAEWRKRNT